MRICSSPKAKCSKRAPRLGFVWLLAVLAFATASCGAVCQDEIECEVAAAHLDECCPGAASQLKCVFHAAPFFQVGCDPDCISGTQPDLDVEISKCIVTLDCAALKAKESCGALKANLLEQVKEVCQ